MGTSVMWVDFVKAMHSHAEMRNALSTRGRDNLTNSPDSLAKYLPRPPP